MLRNTLLRATFLVLALMLVAPSATAFKVVAPPPPTCNPWPANNGPDSLQKVVDNTLHDATTTACNAGGNAFVVAGIGYTFATNEAGIVVGILAPVVDGTQDNACQAIYGDPNAPQAACKDIVVALAVTY